MSALNFPSVYAKEVASTAKIPPIRASQSGFSLIEMMIVVSIVAIMTVIAAPNINRALERQRNKDLSETVASALKEARTEAIFRHQNIRVTYDAINIKLEQTVAPKTGSALIRTYPMRQGSVLTPNADNIVFGANKSVKYQATGSDDYIIRTKCDKEGTKDGRIIKVTQNGVISIESEGSQC